MKHFKANKHVKIKWDFLIVIIVIFLSLSNYINISAINSPKLVKIAAIKIDNYNKAFLMKYISTDNLSKDNLDNIIELLKNNKGEIIAINYNMNNTYSILRTLSKNLNDEFNENLSDFSDDKLMVNDEYIVVSYPLGMASDNAYFNNFGPKIPVKMSIISNIVTGIKTSVSNYGINNVQVSAYLNVDITSNIIVPLMSENISEHYEMLLDSKIIMGNVPTYLGNTLESQSPIVTN